MPAAPAPAPAPASAAAAADMVSLARERKLQLADCTRLLRDGADPWHVPDGGGVSALVLASTRAHAGVARALFDACLSRVPDGPYAKAWLNRDLGRGLRLVHVAARLGWADALGTLRDMGATLTGRDAEGQMPLRYAMDATGASASGGSASDAAGVLLAAMRATRPGGVWDAAAAEADVGGGTTLAHACAGAGNVDELLGVLAASNSLARARDDDGRTPLVLAAQRGSAACVAPLVRAGADVSEGQPLHWAALNGHAGVARALLEHGADINAVDVDGCTCVDYARSEDHHELADELEAQAR